MGVGRVVALARCDGLPNVQRLSDWIARRVRNPGITGRRPCAPSGLQRFELQ